MKTNRQYIWVKLKRSTLIPVLLTAVIWTVVGGSIGAPAASVAACKPSGPVGRWDFDDGTGKDLSGTGNDAVLGGMRIYSLGKGRACIELMPGAEPMRIPASESSPLAILRGTICFWLNTAGGRATILEYDNGAVQLNNYRGCFQARFEGEDDFRYWDLILDYDWP